MLAAGISCVLLAACGSRVEAKTPVLRWYVAPDQANLRGLAEACSQASEGRYRLRVVLLPARVDDRRTALLRRLLARDDSADLVGVDTSLTAEVAAAGVLAPVPRDQAKAVVETTFGQATAASSYRGDLVTVPWWLDPYLLWSRGTLGTRIGAGPGTPLTWSQFLAAARQLKASVEVDDMGGAGLAAWVNALVRQAGGRVVGSGSPPKIGLDSDAGRRAAGVIVDYTRGGLGAEPSAGARAAFAGPHGAFLLAPTSAIIDPSLRPVGRDLTWAPFPVLEPSAVGGAPLVGMSLGVPLHSDHRALAFDAIGCLTDTPHLVSLMTSSGHSAARRDLHDQTQVRTNYPFAPLARAAIESGVIEPSTPLWHLVRRGIDQTWRPLEDVATGSTPAESDRRVTDLIAGGPG